MNEMTLPSRHMIRNSNLVLDVYTSPWVIFVKDTLNNIGLLVHRFMWCLEQPVFTGTP